MVSFVITLLIWVGNQALTIYLSFLIVLPLIYTNTLAGFLNVDPEMLEMAETFRLSRWKKFLYIYRPSFMPFLISSCRVALVCEGQGDAKPLAEALQSALISGCDPENRRQAKQAESSVYLMRVLTCPAVIVECGFLSNPDEETRLADENYHKKLAVCIVTGYLRYTDGHGG